MNDATHKELTGYTDQELAFFVKSRLPYLDEKVKSELHDYVSLERKLTGNDIARLTAEKIPADDSGKPRCSKCGTTRLELEPERKSCLVCGHTISRKEPGGLVGIVAEILGGFAG